MSIDLTWRIWVEGECPECKGSGVLPYINSYCRQCGEHWTITPDTDFVLDGSTAPCGCSWTYYREEDFCHECEATGKIKKQIDLKDLKRVMNSGRILGSEK